MKEIDWSKAPADATHWHDKYDCYVACWVKEQEGQRYYSRADGLWRTWVKDRNPLPIDKCIPRPAAKPAWSGEGLPPVGTVCEYYADENSWRRCEIVAHKDGQAVVWVSNAHIWASSGASLRPIRTPEQIAAEERMHNVRNACTAIAGTLDSLRGKTKVERAALAVVEAMIDAGYTRAEP